MDTNKLNGDALTDAVAMIGGGFVGAGVSKVIHEKLSTTKEAGKKPMVSETISAGILSVLGIVGAAYIKANDTTGKAVQGALAGMGIESVNTLVRGLVKPQANTMIATALGSPEKEVRFVPYRVDSSDSYGNDAGDYTDYEEYDPETNSFLSGADFNMA